MKLTREQEEVVAISEGRHLVLAPPGSGKTEMLSRRILRALKEGVDPKRMLCATFTNRAAFEMRERVEKSGVGDLPDMGNLHHACHRYLLSARRLSPKSHVLDEVEQVEFVREVVDVLRDELRRGCSADGRRRGVSLLGLIRGSDNVLRRKYLTDLLESYESKCREKNASSCAGILTGVLIVNQARIGIPLKYRCKLPGELRALSSEGVLGALCIGYAQLKRRFGCVDFDDLVNEAYLSLVRSPVPEERRFSWVQIDEVQDLSPIQWQIVRMMTAKEAVSVYFGDVEQSIYSFLGASMTAFVEMTDGCVRHFFRTNFRATPLLLEVLMRYSIDALASDWDFLPSPAEPRKAVGSDGSCLLRMEGPSSQTAIVDHVSWLLTSGTAENVAILVATNEEAEEYAGAVKPLRWRTVKVSGSDLFASAVMRDFLSFVSLFAAAETTAGWALLLYRFAGVRNRADARYLARRLVAEGVDLRAWVVGSGVSERFNLSSCRHLRVLSALRKNLRPVFLAAERISFRSLYKAFSAAVFGAARRYSLHELLSGCSVAEETDAAGLYAKAVEGVHERMERFLRYADHVYAEDTRPFPKILSEDWLTLTKLKEADLLVGDEKIVISTVHKAKGRQFDAVVVPDVRRILKDGAGDDDDEPRRLLYVAMSRARRHLSLFAADPQSPEMKCMARCFEPGYRSYYMRSAEERCQADWLGQWERLAAMCEAGTAELSRIDEAIASPAAPVIRMAIRCCRHLADPTLRRQRLMMAIESRERRFAECRANAVDVIRLCGMEDRETIASVRGLALREDSRRLAWSVFSYFRASDEREGLGDFLYSRRPELRAAAAEALAESGDARWHKGVVGFASDFDFLAAASDPSHETSIRILLERESGLHARRLRAVLRARAERNR